MDRYTVTFYGPRASADLVMECFAGSPEEAIRLCQQEALALRLARTTDLLQPGAVRTKEPTCQKSERPTSEPSN